MLFSAPLSLKALLESKSELKERATLLAGGTDLVVGMKRGLVRPELILSLHAVPELREIRKEKESLAVGSMTTLWALSHSSIVAEKWGLLGNAVGEIGSEAIRHVATLGGNVCNASPAADSLPALLVFEAEVQIETHGGNRRISLSEFLLGPSRTALREDEVLTTLIVPPPPEGSRCSYLKFGRKKKGDLALVSTAVLLSFQGESVSTIRIGLGAVAPTAIRATRAEAFLVGRRPTDELINKAAETAADEARPISDIRSSASYKKELVCALVRKGLKNVVARERDP